MTDAYRPLSPRQWEVALLVAEGLTDRAIAARLGISPRTVDNTLQAIRVKLPAGPPHVPARRYLAAWVHAHRENSPSAAA